VSPRAKRLATFTRALTGREQSKAAKICLLLVLLLAAVAGGCPH
jgi:hypothetical protein